MRTEHLDQRRLEKMTWQSCARSHSLSLTAVSNTAPKFHLMEKEETSDAQKINSFTFLRGWTLTISQFTFMEKWWSKMVGPKFSLWGHHNSSMYGQYHTYMIMPESYCILFWFKVFKPFSTNCIIVFKQIVHLRQKMHALVSLHETKKHNQNFYNRVATAQETKILRGYISKDVIFSALSVFVFACNRWTIVAWWTGLRSPLTCVGHLLSSLLNSWSSSCVKTWSRSSLNWKT